MPALFAASAARYPTRAATIFLGSQRRYADLQSEIERFAGGLRALGIRPGDRVAIMLPNMPHFLVAFYGALRAGAVVVPTNPLYTTHELEHQLRDSGAVAVVTIDPLFAQLQAALPGTGVRTLIVAGVSSAAPRHMRPVVDLRQRRQGIRAVRSGGIVRRFSDVVKHGEPLRDNATRPGDLAVLQYTGGTTGTAKGAMLTHRNLVTNAIAARHWQGMVREEEVHVLCVAPFFHAYGLTIGMNLAVAGGATMLLVPRFNPAQVVKLARRYKPEFFPGVPTMWVALSSDDYKPGSFSSVRVCISGAAPLPPEVQRRFRETGGAHVVEGYGLTEASPVTHCNPVGSRGTLGSIGVPFPDTDARIIDPASWEALPAGEVGELAVSGPQIMQGYWNRPEETAAVMKDGWLRTGDLGLMEPDGTFRIVDRKKDVIIAGGFNVYPREVEDVLYEHPAVEEAAVVGVPNTYRGETVKAVVVLKSGMTATPEELTGFCRLELAAYKVPRIVEFRDTLPKSLVGKILRRELREDAIGSDIGRALVNSERPA